MKRLILGGGVAGVAAVAAMVVAVSVASPGVTDGDIGPLFPSAPEPAQSGGSVRTTVREVHRFDSFDTLVATADAVAVIRVKDVVEESRDDPDGGYVMTITLTGTVDELLFGDLPSETVNMIFDGAYSEAALKGTHHEWTVPGKRVLIALHRRSDIGAYRPLNRQSVFILSDDGKVTAVWSDPLTSTLDGHALVEIKTRIAEAKRAIQAGEVMALPERPISSPQP